MPASKDPLIFKGSKQSGGPYSEEFGTTTLSIAADGTFVFTHKEEVVQQYNSNDCDEYYSEVRGSWEVGPRLTVVLRPTLPYATIHKKNSELITIEADGRITPVEALRTFVLSIADCAAGRVATPWLAVFRPQTRSRSMAAWLDRQSGDPHGFFTPRRATPNSG